MIQIKGFMKTSMLDYPGKLAAVIFLSRCSFRCHYCHNKELVMDDPRLIPFENEKVFDYLKKKKSWIDGVVISGGEPTLHEGLPELCREIKKIGYSIKLDTNGTNPEMLKQLIEEKLVDYVAMDIKSSKEKYEKAAAVKVNMDAIEKSIKIIKESGVEYEFRTTVVPELVDEEDIPKIGQWISGAKKYYLQQFVPIKTLSDEYIEKSPYTHDVLHRMVEEARKYVQECGVRGL